MTSSWFFIRQLFIEIRFRISKITHKGRQAGSWIWSCLSVIILIIYHNECNKIFLGWIQVQSNACISPRVWEESKFCGETKTIVIYALTLFSSYLEFPFQGGCRTDCANVIYTDFGSCKNVRVNCNQICKVAPNFITRHVVL